MRYNETLFRAGDVLCHVPFSQVQPAGRRRSPCPSTSLPPLTSSWRSCATYRTRSGTWCAAPMRWPRPSTASRCVALASRTSRIRWPWPTSWPICAPMSTRWQPGCCMTSSKTPGTHPNNSKRTSAVASRNWSWASPSCPARRGVSWSQPTTVRLGGNGSAPPRPERSRQEEWAENMRQLFLSSGDHPLILVIKLADRLHNMRTLSAIKNEDKRRRIAKETMDIFAPVANRLGMWQIKWELEDLCFRHLQPVVYQQLREKISQRRDERERFIHQVEEQLQADLANASVSADVTGRPKHIYSIWRKMQKKGTPFEKVYDVHGFRIIVESIPDCYTALGIVHARWVPVPGEFDDYIARPKENGYRSLHTAVISPDGTHMEVQIRTVEMHELAEQGVAAHWRYKEGGGNKLDADFTNKVAWLRALVNYEEESSSASEMMENMRSGPLRGSCVRVHAQG